MVKVRPDESFTPPIQFTDNPFCVLITALRTIKEDERGHGTLAFRTVAWGLHFGEDDVRDAVMSILNAKRGVGEDVSSLDGLGADVDATGFFETGVDDDAIRRKIEAGVVEHIQTILQNDCHVHRESCEHFAGRN